MIIQQAYRFELRPRKGPQTLLARHAGTARFAWNWGLAQRLDVLARGERVPRAIAQHRELNASKGTDFPWMYQVSKCAAQEALRDLDRGFANWWAGRARRPRFKKKGVHDAFRLTGSIRVLPHAVQLPRLGRVRTKEPTSKMQGRILSATVSREADRWYVSLAVERERPDPEPVEGAIVGLDLGLESFAVLSDGTVIESPRALNRDLAVLQRRQRELSRKEKGSRNRAKATLRVARVHRRVRNRRRAFLHETTTWLAKTKSAIVVEDLHVKGMARNRALARSIADAGWGEFRRMLEYKTQWYGADLRVAPGFYPSSKLCSGCGSLKVNLGLGERIYACDSCGRRIGRDMNAAMNLKLWATGSSPGSDACGDRPCGGTGSGPVYEHPVAEAGTRHGIHAHA